MTTQNLSHNPPQHLRYSLLATNHIKQVPAKLNSDPPICLQRSYQNTNADQNYLGMVIPAKNVCTSTIQSMNSRRVPLESIFLLFLSSHWYQKNKIDAGTVCQSFLLFPYILLSCMCFYAIRHNSLNTKRQRNILHISAATGQCNNKA